MPFPWSWHRPRLECRGESFERQVSRSHRLCSNPRGIRFFAKSLSRINLLESQMVPVYQSEFLASIHSGKVQRLDSALGDLPGDLLGGALGDDYVFAPRQHIAEAAVQEPPDMRNRVQNKLAVGPIDLI